MACDWVGTFIENPGFAAVRSAIETVLEEDDYLESDEACDCLAACEVIARLQGKWGLRNVFSEDLDKWVEENPTRVPDDLKAAADSAIERILGPDSELPDLWDEGGATMTGTLPLTICVSESGADNCRNGNRRSGRFPTADTFYARPHSLI